MLKKDREEPLSKPMFPLSQLAFRNLGRHKLRNALTALAICISIALVVGLSSAFESAYTQVQGTLSAASGPIDILVRPSDTNTTIPERDIDDMGDVEGVAAVAGRIGEDAGLFKGSKKYKGHIIGVADDDFIYADLRFTKISGERNLGNSGMVIDNRLGISIGTSMEIRGHLFKVVGLYTPTVAGDVTVSEEEYYYAFISLDRAQAMFDKRGDVDYALVKVSNLSKLQETARRLRDNYSSLIVYEVTRAASERATTFASSFQRSLQFMAFVAFLLASFICFNTAYLNVIERTREVGLLRAVGAGRLQIFLMFLAESIVISLIGAVLGLLFGLGLTLGFNVYLSSLYNVNFSLPTPDLEMLTLVFELGLGSAMLGGLIPSIDAGRLNVIRAIQHRTSPSGNPLHTRLLIFFSGVALILVGQYVAPQYSIYYVGNIDVFSLSLITLGAVLITVSLLELFSKVLQVFTFVLVGRLSELPVKNIARNLGKSALCLILVTLSLTFVIAIGGMESTVTGRVTGAAGGFFTSDLILYSNTGFPTDFPDELASRYGEIDKLVGVRVVSDDIYNPDREYGRLGNSSIYSHIMTVDPDAFFSVVEMTMSADTSGHPADLLDKDRSCLISRTLAQSLHLGIGDDLGIKTIDEVFDEDDLIYKEVEEMHKLQIVGMIDDPNLGFLWFGGRPFDEMVITTFDSLESIHDKAVESPDLDISNLVFIKVDSGYEDQIQSLKEKILGRYGEEYDLNIFTRDDLISMVQGNINDIFNIFYMALGFSLLVAAVGMANVMTISVSQRGWEIYVLRALGASRRQVSLSFYAETFALSMIGLGVGLATGLYFWSTLSSTFIAQGVPILSILPLRAIELSFYAVIAVTLVSGTYPAWKASNILPVGRLIGAPRRKRKSRAERLLQRGVEKGAELSKMLPQIGTAPWRTPRQRQESPRLSEITRQLRAELNIKPRPKVLPRPAVEPRPKVLPRPAVEPRPKVLPRPAVEPRPTVTSVPVSDSELSLLEGKTRRPGLRLSVQITDRLRGLSGKSEVLSFLVPDSLTSSVAESILEWLPEGTEIVEITTADAENRVEDLVNAVVILCYSPLSNEIGEFLRHVPSGNFRVVLVPSSTFERLLPNRRSEIGWSLEARVEYKQLAREEPAQD